MKLLTLNFLTCAIKTCKALPAAFPLHVRDAELEAVDLDFNPLFLRNVLGRLEWPAMRAVLAEVGLALPEGLPAEARRSAAPAPGDGRREEEEEAGMDVDVGEGKEAEGEVPVAEATLRRLHELLMETQIVSGKLVCGNCGHEYAVREGIPNFLLPAHLV